VVFFAALGTEFHKVFVARTEEAVSHGLKWRVGTGENIWIMTHDTHLFVCLFYLNTKFLSARQSRLCSHYFTKTKL